MNETEHDIRRQQGVTRWVEGVRAAAKLRTRLSGVHSTRDEEFVVEHIEIQHAEIERLRADLRTLTEAARDASAALEEVSQICDDSVVISLGGCPKIQIVDLLRRQASMTRRAIPGDPENGGHDE